MSIYDIRSFAETVKGNSYVGRGIVAGLSADGKKAVTAYFIMGRSTNSRIRVFDRTALSSMPSIRPSSRIRAS